MRFVWCATLVLLAALNVWFMVDFANDGNAWRALLHAAATFGYAQWAREVFERAPEGR